jgi:HAD superfamily hydrolase (TIGR01509 family)
VYKAHSPDAALFIVGPRSIISPRESLYEKKRRTPRAAAGLGAPLLIFDCNGVLVDSEAIAATVAADELTRVGFTIAPEVVARFFAGRRPIDMLADIEAATGRKLPPNFPAVLASATLRRLRAELRPTAHMEYALTWLRGPKCVASSAPLDRVRVSLESTGLLRFFDPYLFSASDVPRGKPSPDLFLHAAAKMHATPSNCVVVEDSPAGVAAATAAGMIPIGFIGGSHSGPNLGAYLTSAGARAVIADMRALKSTVVALRGW